MLIKNDYSSNNKIPKKDNILLNVYWRNRVNDVKLNFTLFSPNNALDTLKNKLIYINNKKKIDDYNQIITFSLEEIHRM